MRDRWPQEEMAKTERLREAWKAKREGGVSIGRYRWLGVKGVAYKELRANDGDWCHFGELGGQAKALGG